MQDPSPVLLDLLTRRLLSEARTWQARVDAITGIRQGEAPDALLAEPLTAFDTDGFLAAYTAAARALGKAPLGLGEEEREQLRSAGVTWPLDGLRLDELGRMCMLAQVSSRLPPEELDRVLDPCYRQGDSRERQALLRALPFVTGAERFVGVAIDACRTNEVPLFEAVACENPYPAAHFPALSFNQMVLKAMFLGLSLHRIVGLAQRKSSELARMAEDYASERRAAGRSVPADIGLLSIDPEQEPGARAPA
jgi:hypothetical protein